MDGSRSPEAVPMTAILPPDDDGQFAASPHDDSATVGLLRSAEEGDVDAVDYSDEDSQVEPKIERERWNHPRINVYRYCSVNLSFFVLGMHDGCIGVGSPSNSIWAT